MGLKKITKYHNDLNKINLAGWNSLEMDLLFAALTQIRDQGTNEIYLSTADLADLIDYAGKNSERFAEIMANLQKKAFEFVFIDIKKEFIDGGKKRRVTMTPMRVFDNFNVVFDEDHESSTVLDGYVRVVVSKDFEYLVNKLVGNFTVFELQEFSSLSSTYSKTAYRVLKQWRTVGYRYFEIDEFRAIFGVPDNYKMFNITQKILRPIERELRELEDFKKLRIIKDKKSSRGSPVVGIKFIWTPEVIGEWEDSKFARKEKKDKKKKGRLVDYDNRFSLADEKDWIEKKLKASRERGLKGGLRGQQVITEDGIKEV